jgi:hypothetical protein
MRSRGVDVSDATDGGRLTASGMELRWKIAVLGAKNPLPIFFIEHATPMAARRKQFATSTAQPAAASDDGKAALHPNGVYALERTYIVTRDIEGDAAIYARVLGLPRPAVTNGTVIMSDMAVFQIGPTGLGVVQPYAAGPAATALERRGPGPFQALYRTISMGNAARWMHEQGLPPLARGVRNTGEHAMLAPPDIACGGYIGFVGPE